MRIKETNGAISIWISANESYEWARNWPCSELKGRRVFASFEKNGDLVDMLIDGKTETCDCNEFNSITSDFIATKFPNHPAAQFAETLLKEKTKS